MAKIPKKKSSDKNRHAAKPNHVVTRSGNTIKVHTTLADRLKARRDAKALKKTELLRDLPKSRVKRILYRLHPKRLYKYWFSKEGAIMALKITGAGIVVMFILMIGVFAYFRKDLPNLKDISGNNIGGSIRYYDKTGQTLLWEDYDAVKRIPVESDQINQFMKDATIAIEDRDFYHHGGFDVKGITRAAWSNVTGGGTSQGGSTITQQLVKLTRDWTEDKTYTRKVKELILSVELERSYSKNEILTGYLNTAPYGGIEYGVEAAAKDYFQKSAKDLTLDEAAFLAAIPKSPTLLSPYSARFERSVFLGRQQYVLDQMADMGTITAKQRDEAKSVDVLAKVKERSQKYDNIKAPYFVLTAKAELERRFTSETVKRGGWKVTTTLDMGMQTIAEQQVSKGLAQIKRQGGDTAAFAATDIKTGQMVALVGGVDFENNVFGKFNYATTPLPPGSSVKPYDYVTLIDSTTNFGAGSVLYDTQGALPGYPCTNKSVPGPNNDKANCLWDNDRKYPGPITIRYALGGSRNVPAVKAALIAGVDKVAATAEKLGLTSGYKCYLPGRTLSADNETECGPSSAIGDGAFLHLDEHVNGYASFARNGSYIPQTYILKIEDAAHKVVHEWKQDKGTQAVRPEAAYIIADMLSDPNPSYFPASAKPQRYKGASGTWKFALKTGTTNDAKDGWMMGFSSQYAAGVWVGDHNRQKEMTGSMENMTLPIWAGFMRAVHDKIPPVDFTKPSGVQTLPAFVIRNHVGYGSIEPSTATDIFPSWYQAKKGNNTPQTIDIVSNKLATDCTPARAKKTETTGGANAFSGDTFVNGGNGAAQTDQKDDIHQCADNRPTITLDVNGNGGVYSLRATVTQGTHPLNSSSFPGTVNFKVNGQTISGGSFTVTEDGQTVEATYIPSSDGSFDITAEVIDSVLYDATDSRSGVPMQAFKANVTGTKKDFAVTWSNLGSGYSYSICVDGNSNCKSSTSNSVAFTNQSNNNHTVTVEVLDQSGASVAKVTAT